MEPKDLPGKYKKIWDVCVPYFKECRYGDDKHALKVVETILNYKGKLKFDSDILVPVAIMHDIGHSAILPEHFKYITGGEKIVNGKLAHMLIGANIAKKVLESVNYDKKKSEEIVDIISIHDSDQLKGMDLNKIFNTKHKKLFHDFDVMDRFNVDRLNTFLKGMGGIEKNKGLLKEIKGSIEFIFYDEFKELAKNGMKEVEEQGVGNA